MNSDLRTLMERYEQELLALRSQAVPLETQTGIAQQTVSTAPLQVRVTAANEAIPIADALVIISRENGNDRTVVKTALTDRSGLTELMVLPATDPSLTLQPENNIPLITYEIQVAAPGYYRIRNSGIPLYGGVTTTLPISMVPLPEFEAPEAELDFNVPRNNL